jgi:EmrB/QacA subfamily drug resistance transporter
MAGVDARIVLVGLPTIAKELHAGVADVIWVSQAYVFASTLGLLLIGRTTDLLGRVKIYNYGFVIFTLGSAFAALSFSSAELIAARIVQGVGASMLITNSAAILADSTPRNELGKILGINTVAFRLGSITGLTLSGAILSVADWRALFYINIPIGIFGTLWAYYRLKEISKPEEYRGMDWIGFAAFSTGLGLLLIAITFLSFGLAGVELGFGMAAVGGLLLFLFVKYELRGRTKIPPLLDMKLFKIKEFAGGSLAQTLNAIAWSGILIMASFYLQIVVGASALQTGIDLLAIDATFIFAAPLAGRFSDKYGSRTFVLVGLTITSAAFFMFALVPLTPGIPTVIIALGLLGLGNGLFISPNVSAVMGSVPANRRGIASGLRTTFFNVGDSVGFGLAVLIMTLVIPYNTLNILVQNYSVAGQAVGKQEFILGFQLVAVALATINTFAIIPGSWTGRKREPVIEKIDINPDEKSETTQKA